MNRNWMRVVVRVSGAVLLALALTRLLSIAEGKQLLTAPDPVVGISVRLVALVVGVLELAVALVCLFGKSVKLQAGLVVWLAFNFVVYRAGLIWLGYHERCSGWGSLTNPLHLPYPATDYAICAVMVGMAVGGGVVAVWHREEPVPRAVANLIQTTFKISCTKCGGHIEFDAGRAGQQTACPHCAARIILRQPENVKTSCRACGGHIEFPSHAMGRAIACPHCAVRVILEEVV